MRGIFGARRSSGAGSGGRPSGASGGAGGENPDRGGAPRRAGAGLAHERRLRRRSGTQDDPFRLDGDLFDHVTHIVHHGEAFAAYRLRGHPMVLRSLVDGLPLACLHLRVAGPHSDVASLISRRPEKDNEYLGIISADEQEFELVMTNLTTDQVMMFDIGGVPREREADYWDLTDASYWSGRHRNDQRLNRSNILWPMTSNVCSENNLHFQECGEHRRLVLRARASTSADPAGSAALGSADVDVGYPLHVYPKFGSRTAEKFARTAWSCPATILVVGTPALLDGDFREGHNIVLQRPSGSEAPQNPVDEVASFFGISPELLMQTLGVERATIEASSVSAQRVMLGQLLATADLSSLEREDSIPALQAQDRGASATTIRTSSVGTRPAEVAVGRRLLGAGAHSLLVEKFDFDRRGASATLSLAVQDELQLCEDTTAEVEADEQHLRQRLENLVETRTEELLGDVQGSAVFATAECVVCMDVSPPPDTVLYQCGHQCVHLRCVQGARLRRCPLCRSPIVALLPSARDRSEG
mmetsp:Transcript_63242/g.137564  ORF Transcript_63242/g.137564 Transcript_63242/m.137564 type:complete len:529 (-) Transcript_63242:28-1614(-)